MTDKLQVFKANSNNLIIVSVPPKRQLLRYVSYDGWERKESFFDIELPYMHYVLDKWRSIRSGDQYYMYAVVMSVDPIDPEKNIEDLKIFPPYLPNCYYYSPTEVAEMRQYGRCDCGCGDDSDEYTYPYIGTSCADVASFKNTLDPIDSFWSQGFNADLFYYQTLHPYIIEATKDNQDLLVDTSSFSQKLHDILEILEQIPHDTMMERLGGMKEKFSFMDVNPCIVGNAKPLDLDNVDYAT